MKKFYLMSLPLAAALVMPAAAQNSNSSDQQAQPSQSQTQQAQPAPSADQNATGKEPLKYERHEGFWGKMNPFARKKYVARQLDPIRGRVNELDELTAKNAKMIAAVDSRATEGIRQGMSKAKDADSHALDAGKLRYRRVHAHAAALPVQVGIAPADGSSSLAPAVLWHRPANVPRPAPQTGQRDRA